MNLKNKRILKRLTFYLIGFIPLIYFITNSVIIYRYSFEYAEEKADVAIVLGAGTDNGELSPVYKERANHGIYLYKNGFVDKIIFTGGLGKRQTISDSKAAKRYAIKQGVPENDILIEETSVITLENLEESKIVMDSLNYKTALLVSDPLHMKRAMYYADKTGLTCNSSPTRTSMYKSFGAKSKSLLYETFFYSFGRIYHIIIS